MDSFTFTVGKLDAGMAILIGERAHLIEFPSLLLPPGVSSGSIVNIAVHRNTVEEKRQRREFWELQDQILETFGVKTPQPPQLQVRNVTQTSVTLEWPPIQLATAGLRSLDIYRNQQRLAPIPFPLQNTSTKLSGLEQDTAYIFQLVLRTTAGVFPSNIIKLKTHTMADTSGISVCFGNVQDKALLEDAKLALEDMKAKWSDRVQIDTTHFVCTTPASTPQGASATGGTSGAPGVEYQKALQASIPIVQPQWILGCLQARKMVPISQYYLGATPPAAQYTRPTSTRITTTGAPRSDPLTSVESPQPKAAGSTSPFVNQPAEDGKPSQVSSDRTVRDSKASSTSHTSTLDTSSSMQSPESSTSLQSTEDGQATPTSPGGTTSVRTGKPAKRRQGTMQKDFRFPSPVNKTPTPPAVVENDGETTPVTESGMDEATVSAPPSNVPPALPTPGMKTPAVMDVTHDGDEEVGETEEVDLS
ncbi:Chitin synthase, class 5 [Tulasnella sp. 332]|nr:Chitin synthase, class 5 [Tulasnella sp. 332]